MEISKKELGSLIKEVVADAEEKTERYMGALKEDFDYKFEAVMEALEPLDGMNERLTSLEDKVNSLDDKVGDLAEKVDNIGVRQEAMFEKLGEVAVDVTEIKEVVKDHEVRLQKLESHY